MWRQSRIKECSFIKVIIFKAFIISNLRFDALYVWHLSGSAVAIKCVYTHYLPITQFALSVAGSTIPVLDSDGLDMHKGFTGNYTCTLLYLTCK